MLDRAFAVRMQTALYALGSPAQVILGRMRTLPFEQNFGRHIVVIIQWQNMEMRMGDIEACGQHAYLLWLIQRVDKSSHSFDHEHERDKRGLLQVVKSLHMLSGNDEQI